MQNNTHLPFLLEGVKSWNARRNTDNFIPNFEGLDFHRAFVEAGEIDSSEILDLSGVHFEAANLNGATLDSVVLDGAVLDRSQMHKTKLRSASLRSASLQKTDFFSADLSEADLSNADAEGAQFVSAKLKAAKLFGTNLKDVSFRDSILDACWLVQARLDGADFTRASVKDIDLLSFVSNVNKDSKGNITSWSPKSAALRGALYISQEQLEEMKGDSETSIPENLSRPSAWPNVDIFKNLPDRSFSHRNAKERLSEKATITEVISNSSRDLANVLSLIVIDLDAEIERLKASLPNDEGRHKDYLSFINFLERMRRNLLMLAEGLEKETNSVVNHSSDTVLSTKDEVLNWFSENQKEFIDLGIRVPAMGASISFLALCGANMAVATPVMLALFGGKKVVEIIKASAK